MKQILKLKIYTFFIISFVTKKKKMIILLSSILLLLNASPLPNAPPNVVGFKKQGLSAIRSTLKFKPFRAKQSVRKYSYRKTYGGIPSYSFKEAEAYAKLKGFSPKNAYQFAIEIHDPLKDDFAIVKFWMQNKDPKAKDAFKKKMLKNPILRNIIRWKVLNK